MLNGPTSPGSPPLNSGLTSGVNGTGSPGANGPTPSSGPKAPGAGVRLNEIIDLLSRYNRNADTELVRRAYVFSAKVHAGQQRHSGEPYLFHPLEVAHILTQMRMDPATVATGLLHDTVEDTLTTVDEIRDLFGEDVAFLVDGVTKLSKLTFASKEERQAESFRKMMVAMAQDLRVMIVKLADRLHNMRTLGHMKPAKQIQIAQETLDIYAPLANRLGISWVKAELEDLSFRYLHPGDYEQIFAEYDRTKGEREKKIAEIIHVVEKQMAAHGIECEVSGRAKHIYSIYRKMRQKNVDFHDIHDLAAFRIVVKDLKGCYEALGVIHAEWTPVPGRFKDYIAVPKLNGYQSLHTTVVGRVIEGRIEVQIRTRDMHDLAEEGIAAHWRYKEGGYNSGDAARFEWLRRMMDTQKELDDSGEYMDAVRLDLFSDEVYVFTPKGDVVELPNGATPLDLAFHIHTDLGLQCVGAKVNGVMVPLRHKLKSGDAIEILRSKTAKPNKDWLKFVTTARAKSKIRSFLRIEQRAKSLELGEEILEREAQKHDVGMARFKKTDDINKVAPQFKAKDTEELYRLIGIGKVDPKQVLKALVPELNIEEQPKERSALGKLFDKVTRKNVRSGIEVQGIDDMLTHLAKCCNPIPGDPVVGFVTRGRGVVVHRKDCPRCQDYDPERKVDVRWVGDSNNRHKVGVRVITQNQPGVLANISAVFSKAGININEANCRTFADQRAVNDFTVDVGNLDQLRQVIIDIERLKGVVTAERIPSK